MTALPTSIPPVIATLAAFLILTVALKYAISNNFVRTRFLMTAFFCFIVITLSSSFWEYASATLPYTIPAALLGILLGYLFGVRTAEQKLRLQGAEHYMEHFAHIHPEDFKNLTWWSVINFYTVMGSLLIINLVGLSNVIFGGAEGWAIGTSVVGAFLLGTILPYLIHLWAIRATENTTSTTSEA